MAINLVWQTIHDARRYRRASDDETETTMDSERNSDPTSNVTYACANGWHGTAERRTMKSAGGFAGMYTGKCSGTVRSMNGGESWCTCECHGAVPANEPGALPDVEVFYMTATEALSHGGGGVRRQRPQPPGGAVVIPLLWHICNLCRLPGAPKVCSHADRSISRLWIYCNECGAVAENPEGRS
jgi:hypothetical protein